jgi:hypothetical protein
MYCFIFFRNFTQASMTSGCSCPSKYSPLQMFVYEYPNLWSQLMAVHSDILVLSPVSLSAGHTASLTCLHSLQGVMAPIPCAARYLQTPRRIIGLSGRVCCPQCSSLLEVGSRLCLRRYFSFVQIWQA